MTPDRLDWPLVFLAHAGCERLRVEIATHLRAVQLRLFEETPGGDVQVQTAAGLAQARAGILLLNKDALASDPVLEQLRALLRRHDQDPGGFPIYPILAGACAWEVSPLAGRNVLPLPADRDTLWARIAGELRRSIIASGATGSAARQADPPPILAPPQVPASRRTLTVLLGCSASGEVRAGYHSAAHTTPPRRTGALPAQPAQADGAALYELLFPPAQDLQPLLGEPVPSRQPVRLRICTSDPALVALPWQRASWHGRPLLADGWSFEITARADLVGAHTLHAPCKVQVHAPPEDDGLGALVTERLRRLGEHRLHAEFFRATSCPRERERARRGLEPHLLFHSGPDLPESEGPAPLFAWLEGAGLVVARRLFGQVPLVVVVREGQEVAARRLLSRFLDLWLDQALDPVQALHLCWPLPDAPVIVHSDYEVFQTRRLLRRRPAPGVGLRLDRDDQRARADRHIKELVAGARRVEAMLAYAGPGNLLAHFPAQVIDYVEEYQGESRAPVLLKRVVAPMPLAEEDREDLPAALRREVEAFFEYAPPETREQMLRRQGPERKVPGTTVLLLDFGAHRAEVLGADEIEGWLAFCRDYLVRHCPQEMRIVAYLGHEIALERHKGFHDYMEAEVSIREDNYSDRFRLTVLPALGNVTLRHLIDFLTSSENTTCEATLARKVAARIHEASAGSYEQAVRLIQQGEDEGFTTLLASLDPRRGQRRTGQPY